MFQSLSRDYSSSGTHYHKQRRSRLDACFNPSPGIILLRGLSIFRRANPLGLVSIPLQGLFFFGAVKSQTEAEVERLRFNPSPGIILLRGKIASVGDPIEAHGFNPSPGIILLRGLANAEALRWLHYVSIPLQGLFFFGVNGASNAVRAV